MIKVKTEQRAGCESLGIGANGVKFKMRLRQKSVAAFLAVVIFMTSGSLSVLGQEAKSNSGTESNAREEPISGPDTPWYDSARMMILEQYANDSAKDNTQENEKSQEDKKGHLIGAAWFSAVALGGLLGALAAQRVKCKSKTNVKCSVQSPSS